MVTPRISICGFLYNFAHFLGEALEAIVPKALPNLMNIGAIGGASTNKSPEVIAAFRGRRPNAGYDRLKRKDGIDRNIAKDVELSRGGFRSLFTGNSLMREEAIAPLPDCLNERFDVLLMEPNLANPALEKNQHLVHGRA